MRLIQRGENFHNVEIANNDIHRQSISSDVPGTITQNDDDWLPVKISVIRESLELFLYHFLYQSYSLNYILLNSQSLEITSTRASLKAVPSSHLLERHSGNFKMRKTRNFLLTPLSPPSHFSWLLFHIICVTGDSCFVFSSGKENFLKKNSAGKSFFIGSYFSFSFFLFGFGPFSPVGALIIDVLVSFKAVSLLEAL